MSIHFGSHVDCVCGHLFYCHVTRCNTCFCEEYDPAGHNPEIYNIVCPQCKLCWMIPNVEGRYYECLSCTFILFNRQVHEMSKGT